MQLVLKWTQLRDTKSGKIIMKNQRIHTFRNSACHPPNTLLRMKFEKIGDKICLSQPKHINHGLEELGLTNYKPSSTPLTPNLQLREATDEDHDKFKRPNINYRSAIVWRDTQSNPDLELTIYPIKPSEFLLIYSNATWGDDPDSRTSQSGYLKHSISHSLNEEELNPLVKSSHEGVWLKALINEMWNLQIESTAHFIDDKELSHQLTMDDKTFKELKTQDMIADALTKPTLIEPLKNLIETECWNCDMSQLVSPNFSFSTLILKILDNLIFSSTPSLSIPQNPSTSFNFLAFLTFLFCLSCVISCLSFLLYSSLLHSVLVLSFCSSSINFVTSVLNFMFSCYPNSLFSCFSFLLSIVFNCFNLQIFYLTPVIPISFQPFKLIQVSLTLSLFVTRALPTIHTTPLALLCTDELLQEL
ncbi:hypothetical protein VP01_3015g1 [Puccinia sorghi]|uniref:Uncharacterized protein n=1 Tax=Puccinia sorghi TaxID=27349 RepID=A0A0L6V0A7_9BASI|nr:hypothetical protein VP01_3015g1 [Puccinia sorghi]